MLSAALLAISLPQSPLPAQISAQPLPAIAMSPSEQPVFSNGAQPEVLLAQSITPADAGTVVTPTDNQIEITGGQFSGDGANLFHSFEQFGLSQQQTANFIANPQVHNVLGRVQGGDASYIDGRLQVTNSDANLFLINPAGILFGENASLDLNGSFTAATADRLGFDGGWLDVFDSIDYGQLGGDPSQFSFSAAQPGSVVNLGDLAVDANQNLTLLGGTVVNVGSVSAASGRITLAAVNGQQTVTLGSTDGLLTMELAPLAIDRDLSILSLPDLLTGGSVSNSSALAVAADGTVLLQGVTIPENSGTTAVAGTLDVTGQVGGDINLLGDRVALLGADLAASGLAGGGTTRIGGGYQGNDPIPNADLTYVDADTTLDISGGDTGDGGLAVVWADGLTSFYGDVDASGGSQFGDGGFVEISGKDSLVFDGTIDLQSASGEMGQLLLDPNSVVIGDVGTDDSQLDNNVIDLLEGGVTSFISAGKVAEILNGGGGVTINATNDIRIDSFINGLSNDNVSDLRFSAGQIELNNSISLRGGDVVFSGPVLLNKTSGSVSVSTAGDVIFENTLDSNNDGTSRNLEINAEENVVFGGAIGSLEAPNFLRVRATNVSLLDYLGDDLDIRARGDLTFEPQQNVVLGGTIRLEADNNLNISTSNTLDLSGVELTASPFQSDGSLTIQAPSLTITNSSEINSGGTLTLESQSLSSADSQIESRGDLILQGVNGMGFPTIMLSNSSLTTDETLRVHGSATSAAGNIDVIGSLLRTGGDLELLGQSVSVTPGSEIKADANVAIVAASGIVTIADAAMQPTVVEAGSELNLEGDTQIIIQALSAPQSVLRSGSNLSLLSSGNITANGRFASGGDFTAGPGSLLFMPIDDGGIISSVGDVSFDEYMGASLKIEAGGNITGGNVTIIDPDTSLSGTDPDIALLSNGPAVVLRAGIIPQENLPPSASEFQNTPTLNPGDTVNKAGTVFATSAPTTGNISVGTIVTDAETDEVGTVLLAATGEITTGDITTDGEGGSVIVIANDSVQTGDISVAGRDSSVNLVSETGNVDVNTILSSGRDIRITAAGTFRANGTFEVGTLVENKIETNDLPVSLALTRFDSDGVTILHNGATEADPAFSNDRIRIGGNGEQFVVGPEVIGKIDPNAGEFIDPIQGGADLRRNETYAPRTLPDETSGTAGGITIGGFGTNGFLSVSVQDIPFVDAVEPSEPSEPVVETPLTPTDNDPIVMGGEVEVQANEEQVDRQANTSVCNFADETLIAQGSLRGDGDESPEDSVNPDVEQITQRDACGQPDIGDNILVVEDAIEPLDDGADSEQ